MEKKNREAEAVAGYNTECGFVWGAVQIDRRVCDGDKGFVEIGLKTAKQKLAFRVTKTGKIRIFDYGNKYQELVLKTKEK